MESELFYTGKTLCKFNETQFIAFDLFNQINNDHFNE